jgi:hypothetical protein
MMEITRNQYFCVGLVLLFMGIEFRAIDSAVLTPEFTGILAQRSGSPVAAVNSVAEFLSPAKKPVLQKTVHPPEWIGWTLLTVGCVAVFHALAMPRQGGA